MRRRIKNYLEVISLTLSPTVLETSRRLVSIFNPSYPLWTKKFDAKIVGQESVESTTSTYSASRHKSSQRLLNFSSYVTRSIVVYTINLDSLLNYTGRSHIRVVMRL